VATSARTPGTAESDTTLAAAATIARQSETLLTAPQPTLMVTGRAALGLEDGEAGAGLGDGDTGAELGVLAQPATRPTTKTTASRRMTV
jgi:hypothetical protein